MSKLIGSLKIEEISILSDSEILERKKVVDFIFKSVAFLDSSAYSTIPHEIVYCLECALKEWENTENYIIVTSLINDVSGFSFDTTLVVFEEYCLIINK